MRFTEGQRVVVIDSNNVAKRGVVKTAVDAIEVAVIDLGDGSSIKAKYNHIGLDIADQNDQEPETPEEPEKKSEITITREEFSKLTTRVIGDFCKRTKCYDIDVFAPMVVIAVDIERALFEGEND